MHIKTIPKNIIIHTYIDFLEGNHVNQDISSIALFIDFENISIGVEEQLGEKVNIQIIVDKLAEFGTLVVRKAYSDWNNNADYKRILLQSGIELIERSHLNNAKNGADIKLAIDAVELALRNPQIDTFAIVSGDSDFVPLIQKLREYNKKVIGVGGDGFTSKFIPNSCDEYISYETLLNIVQQEDSMPPDYIINLLDRSIRVLLEHGKGLDSSGVKSKMRNFVPTFDEINYGFEGFNKFIDYISEKKILPIKKVWKNDAWYIEYISEEYSNINQSNDNGKGDRILSEEERKIILDIINEAFKEGRGKEFQGADWYIENYLIMGSKNGLLSLDNLCIESVLNELIKFDILEKDHTGIFSRSENYEVNVKRYLSSDKLKRI